MVLKKYLVVNVLNLLKKSINIYQDLQDNKHIDIQDEINEILHYKLTINKNYRNILSTDFENYIDSLVFYLFNTLRISFDIEKTLSVLKINSESVYTIHQKSFELISFIKDNNFSTLIKKDSERFEDVDIESIINKFVKNDINDIVSNISNKVNENIVHNKSKLDEDKIYSVLLISDDFIIRNVLKNYINTYIHNIYEASSEFEAIQILTSEKTKKLNIIFLDLTIVKKHGLELLFSIRSEDYFKDTHIIVISETRNNDVLVSKCIENGANDFISKDFNPSVLVSRIKNILDKHSYLSEKNKSIESLKESIHNYETELNEASKYIKKLLPSSFNTPKIEVYYKFIPSKKLGGDFIDYFMLDEENFVFYLLDVSGHGIKSSLLAVSALNFIRYYNKDNSELMDPSNVLNDLNTYFKSQDHDNMFLSIWYGLYNTKTRELKYSCAGAPPGIMISKDGSKEDLYNQNVIIGVDPSFKYSTSSTIIKKNSSLYLFSDGTYEIKKLDGDMLNLKTFKEILYFYNNSKTPLNKVLSQVKSFNSYYDRDHFFDDDFTIIQVIFK